VTITNEPWSIHIVRVDRAAKGIDVLCTHAHDRVAALATVAEQAGAVSARGRNAIAAINGDFFVIKTGSYQGDPLGLEITNGKLLSAPKEAAFWMDHGVPHIDAVRSQLAVTWPDGRKSRMGLNEAVPGNSIVLFTAAFASSTRATNAHELILQPERPDSGDKLRAGQKIKARVSAHNDSGDSVLSTNTFVLAAGREFNRDFAAISNGSIVELNLALTKNLGRAEMGVGGGPILVHNGTPKTWAVKTNVTTGLFIRNPRTAIGYNRTSIFLVEVDGRQKDLSVGMTFPELARLMKDIGCTDALNLDGGGSSTLWLNGRVLNSPSDKHERAVADAVVVATKATDSGRN
jgi:uncharacterized protein YigE (DUF2233 family)